MPSHLNLSDKEFEIQFQSASMPPDMFDHEAHLRLAWIHIKKYGVDQAVLNVCAQLKNYVTHLGVTDKYNQTLTIAAVKAVNHFVLKSETRDFTDFIGENSRLKTDFKTLMFSHYKTDIFNSPLAKARFIEPELLPFD
jgi:hypothetical protein